MDYISQWGKFYRRSVNFCLSVGYTRSLKGSIEHHRLVISRELKKKNKKNKKKILFNNL